VYRLTSSASELKSVSSVYGWDALFPSNPVEFKELSDGEGSNGFSAAGCAPDIIEIICFSPGPVSLVAESIPMFTSVKPTSELLADPPGEEREIERWEAVSPSSSSGKNVCKFGGAGEGSGREFMVAHDQAVAVRIK
jgi:hypothetical protein